MSKSGLSKSDPGAPDTTRSRALHRAAEPHPRHCPSAVSRNLGHRASSPPSRGLLRITLPELDCPFPASMHLDAQPIEEGTIAWMKRYGYIRTPREEETARHAEFGIRAARVHPTGRTEAIQLVSDLTVWLFLTDDVYVEEPGQASALAVTAEHVIRSIRVLRNPEDLPVAPNASLLALQDISNRLRAAATHEQVERVVNGMVEFFLAGCCEAVSFSRKSLPLTADYIPVRDAINCLRSVCFVFIEIVGGYELPGRTWSRPDLQAVVNTAVRIISNHHDVLSGLRELTHDVPMNLPAVIAREEGLPISEAFARVADLANAEMNSFVAMSDRLLADEKDRTVRDYVEGLKAWIRGNLDWSLTTGRYRVSDYLMQTRQETPMPASRRSMLATAGATIASLGGTGAASASKSAVADPDVARLIQLSEESNDVLLRGDIDRYRELITLSDDFTLMSPFGGTPTRGADMTDESWNRMGRFFRNGALKLELVQSYATADMVVLAIIERGRGEVGGLPAQDWPLRVTLVYRRDGAEWRLVHRHADPLVAGITLQHAAALARGEVR
jgi:hypothetical protein